MSWIDQLSQEAATGLVQFFTTPFFTLGDKQLSLAAIAVLVLLAIAAFLISRFVSHVLKRSLLSRVGLDRGTQEAIATVISYLLSAFGFIVILQTAGLNLSSLAVFAGVLGIGIGFGLQNLASNFISGITLLFERPIKVGDFIEVGNLLGTVEKISIRSTIVRTNNNVCVIVPNTHFIENNIVNWTYRDPTCRLHLPIGVAVGTDPLLVTEALLTVARMESRVLPHPAPKVWFVGFGDSALKFELLVWINNPPESDPIKSALNFLIEQEFRRRQIEVPFPQHDLRIRNWKELGVVLRAESVGGSPDPTMAETQKLMSQSTHNWTLRVLLRRITYFERCTETELRELIENGYRAFFAKGQTIFEENDPGEAFYILLSGSVEVLSRQTKQALATLHTGDFFGEIALLTGTPRSATVRTLEDTILFVVDRNDLQQLLSKHRDLADQIAQQLAERQQVLQELGLIDEGTLEQMGDTPLTWIRRRIQTIFNL